MPGNPYYRSSHWRELRQARLRIDGYTCVVEGCFSRATFVDHIVARPGGCPVPCREDRLDNLRSLCTSHDAQVKELARGDPTRRNGGAFRIKGCDANGWPYDPGHQG